MEIVEAYNANNKSTLTFADGQRENHGSINAFRDAVIWKTFVGWETPEMIRKHLAMPLNAYRVPELRIMVQKLIEITPCLPPDLNDIQCCFRVQSTWNAAEYLWQKDDLYARLSWGTTT